MSDLVNYLRVVRQEEHLDWYMLCVDDECFQCISAGPLHQIEDAIRRIRDNYYSAADYSYFLHSKGMFNRGQVYPLHCQTLKAVYDYQQGEYDRVVREILGEPVKLQGHKKKLSPVKPKTQTKKPLMPKVKKQVQKVTAETQVKKLTIPKVAPSKQKHNVFKCKKSKARLSFD